jgi:signal transduction histidine kinase/CheY-like chemotaxis protein/HPt (histidine-containing phosphotransfer) domain-containing protein
VFRKQQLLAAQVGLLYANVNTAVVVTVIGTVILGVLQWGFIPHPVILGWCLYSLVIAALRSVLGLYYRRSAGSGSAVSLWRTAFVIGAALSGAGWGAAAVLLYPETNPAHQIFLVFILGGMMLGAAPILAPRLEAFLAFLFPTGLAPAVRLLVHGDEVHLGMGLLVGVFTVATLLTTRRIHRTIVSSLNLQFENRDLVEELKAARDVLAAEKDRAEAGTRAKSEFLAKMSHEIRTPMNGVIGMTGLLSDSELTADQRRYAETVRSSGEALLEIINDILDFSKIEAKRLEIETMDFDLRGLLDDFASALAVPAYKKGLELFCGLGPETPALLRGDPGRLRQILTNLTGNAIKFTDRGDVTVRVSPLEETAMGCLLRFSVRDTGIGIPRDKIGMIFDTFSQVDSSTSRKYGGTGLGLAISKQLAELMGGTIGVESEAGKGSEFWFTAYLEKQHVGAPVDRLPPAELAGARVLIVDDNANSREILTTLMTSSGIRPSAVGDGGAALQALHRAQEESDPFSIAVIDMHMPGMDGETLGSRIQADGSLARPRMVMLTSIGDPEDSRHLEEIGFASYARKPIRNHELLRALSSEWHREPGFGPADQAVHSAGAAQPFARFNARILLAEDNITNQQVALGILKKLGLRADAVADGTEAVTALQSIPYDLVLMDVQMPMMDGFEATRRIRNLQSKVRNHDIPIIAMTAYATSSDRELCLDVGMNDFVSKPVSAQALADALHRWLPMGNGRGRPPQGGESVGSGLDSSAMVVFDRAGFMERVMNQEDLAQEVIEVFLDDAPRRIEALGTHLEGGNSRGVEYEAHTLKGSAANMGGERLAALAFEFEKAGKAGDLDVVEARLGDLQREFEVLKEAMTKEPRNLGGR